MRLTDIDKLQLKLREYADKKAFNGEIEVANGILKAKCFIDQECTVIEEKQLNNGWIPVSERLPEESDVYLTTFLEEGKRYVERFYYSDFMGWMMPVAWQDEGRIENIIAWQPLPEPYKEEEE